jgi:hypothetical protein
MNARQDGSVWVGVGQYGWYLGSDDDDGRIKKLVIALELMMRAGFGVGTNSCNGSLLCPILGDQASKPAKIFQPLTPCDRSNASLC